MDQQKADLDMFNEGTVLRLKSTFDTFKTQFLKEYHNATFSSNRKTLATGERSQRIGANTTREFADPELNTNDLGKGQKIKSVTFPIESITLYDKKFTEMYSKFSFKVNWQKEYFIVEFFQYPNEPDRMVKYKLEIVFKKVNELIMVKSSNVIVLMFEHLKLVKEILKKKHPMASKCDLTDLEIFKGSVLQSNKNFLSIQFSVENFARLFNPKLLFLERIKAAGIKKTEGSFTKTQSIDSMNNKMNTLQLKEIINSKDLVDVSKFENHLKNSTAEENGEMLKKVSYTKLIDKIPPGSINCPIYSCFESLNSVPALKNHINVNHKELVECGIEVLPSGKIKYSEDVLRSVLMVCKIVPSFVRMCIKRGDMLAEKLSQNNKG